MEWLIYIGGLVISGLVLAEAIKNWVEDMKYEKESKKRDKEINEKLAPLEEESKAKYEEYCRKVDKDIKDSIKENFSSNQSYAMVYDSKVTKLHMGLSKDNKSVVFIDCTKPWPHERNGGKIIPPKPHKIKVTSKKIDDILYFKYDEKTSYTTSVSGGGANVGGAVVGALVAGTTGAIIGGGPKPVKSETKKHTDKMFVVKYANGKEEKDYFSPENYYNAYMKLIPQKEYSFVTTQSLETKPAKNEKSDLDDLVKFKELLDKGIITQEEFDAKKKQILGL